MCYLSVNKDGSEYICDECPVRNNSYGKWINIYSESTYNEMIHLPKGSIKKLIGKELKWENEPFKYK